MVTAKLNGIDPHGYLANVLEHLPSAKSVELDTLLPWNFTTQVSTRRRNHIASTD